MDNLKKRSRFPIGRSVVTSVVILGFITLAVWYGSEYWDWVHRPLGPPAAIRDVPSGEFTAELKHYFLTEKFAIINKVRLLPDPILASVTEKEGGRMLMADPGQHFEATDVITDRSAPSERLIFAGISEHLLFMHYEQGGFAHMFRLSIYERTPSGLKSRWDGHCGGAYKDLYELREHFKHEGCM